MNGYDRWMFHQSDIGHEYIWRAYEHFNYLFLDIFNNDIESFGDSNSFTQFFLCLFSVFKRRKKNVISKPTNHFLNKHWPNTKYKIYRSIELSSHVLLIFRLLADQIGKPKNVKTNILLLKIIIEKLHPIIIVECWKRRRPKRNWK